MNNKNACAADAAYARLGDCSGVSDGDAEHVENAVSNEPLLGNKKWLVATYGIAPGTVDYWVSKAIIPCIRLGPRHVAFDREEVTRWFDERRVPARRLSRQEATMPTETAPEASGAKREVKRRRRRRRRAP